MEFPGGGTAGAGQAVPCLTARTGRELGIGFGLPLAGLGIAGQIARIDPASRLANAVLGISADLRAGNRIARTGTTVRRPHDAIKISRITEVFSYAGGGGMLWKIQKREPLERFDDIEVRRIYGIIP